MIVVTNMETMGFKAAMRGMRNAMNSWHLQDTYEEDGITIIGPNDLKLLTNLTNAGPSHRKALRMMHIQMDITAPLYWWKDYDTYKVSTVANSCSTMHKIHTRDLTMLDLSTEYMGPLELNLTQLVLDSINANRKLFLDTGDKVYWYRMIQLLPTSYNQRRTVDINYETALNILRDRSNHKQDEFREICEFLLNELPYMYEICKASMKK